MTWGKIMTEKKLASQIFQAVQLDPDHVDPFHGKFMSSPYQDLEVLRVERLVFRRVIGGLVRGDNEPV